MKARIDAAKKAGESLGGVFEVAAVGLPPGLGSYTQWDRKLDGLLAQAILSINAIKGVEFGEGFAVARLPGTQAQDSIRCSSASSSTTGSRPEPRTATPWSSPTSRPSPASWLPKAARTCSSGRP